MYHVTPKLPFLWLESLSWHVFLTSFGGGPGGQEEKIQAEWMQGSQGHRPHGPAEVTPFHELVVYTKSCITTSSAWNPVMYQVSLWERGITSAGPCIKCPEKYKLLKPVFSTDWPQSFKTVFP